MYKASKTLPIRTEFVRQLRRRRTAVSYLLMLALPLFVVAAIKFGPESNGGGSSASLNLIDLATRGAWNFVIVMLFFGSGFLLTTVTSLFFGETVAGEASWSTLRYLLAAPIPRRRLLRVKLIVAALLSFSAVLALAVISYFIGWLAFGNNPLVSPVGGEFTTSDALYRVAVIAGYVFLSLLVAAGLAFYMSVRSDVPLGAVGTAVVIVIVIQILDAITALGDLRTWLPGHYAQAWTDALNPTIEWSDMARGGAYAVALFVLFVVLAVLKFDRKDITS
jgi:ABC-2 type transport system permease protein